jgi:hypothetical protein
MAIPYSVYTFGVGYTIGPSPRELQVDRKGSIRRDLPYIALSAVALGIPLLAGLVRTLRTDRDLLTLLLVLMVVPTLAVTALAMRNIKLFNPRYLRVALPAFMILLGAGAAWLTRGRYGFLMLPLVLVMGLSVYNYFANPRYAKDDLRSAARTIEAGYREGDVVVGVFTAEPLEFYLKGTSGVEVFELADISSQTSMTRRCRELAGQGDRVWLSLCREWQVDPEGHIHGWFEENVEGLEEYRFTGARLILYGTGGI